MSVFQFDEDEIAFKRRSSSITSDDFDFIHKEEPHQHLENISEEEFNYGEDDEDSCATPQEVAVLEYSTNAAESVFPVSYKPVPEDFKVIRVIGTGAYGKVFLVQERRSGRFFAMKTLKKASILLHSKQTEHTKAEREILEAVRHPFIVKLYYAFQTKKKLYLVLEYVGGGELFTHMLKERMLSEDVTRFFAAELILALEHLHSLGIIYRDLKPENVLLDRDGHIILTDFGLSKVALDGDNTANTLCGTVEYMAPEIVMDSKNYGMAVDWWAMGIMIYDMLTGSAPFRGRNRKDTMDAIVNKRLKCPSYMSADARDLVTKLLKKNPPSRLGGGAKGVKAIKTHPFFRSIDWDRLYRKELRPFLVPVMTSEDDVRNFDSQFTSQDPNMESPSETPLSPTAEQAFKGFSFIASTSSFPPFSPDTQDFHCH